VISAPTGLIGRARRSDRSAWDFAGDLIVANREAETHVLYAFAPLHVSSFRSLVANYSERSSTSDLGINLVRHVNKNRRSKQHDKLSSNKCSDRLLQTKLALIAT